MNLNLSERENKFIRMIFDHTGGDVSQMILSQDLYPLAERNGFHHPEVTSIVMMLKGESLVEKQTYKGVVNEQPVGLMIACVRLTSRGVRYVRELESSSQIYESLEQRNDDRFEKSEGVISDKDRPCVFLSYARPDRSIVEELYSYLHSKGFKPWMDKEIPGGEEWQPAISKAIKNSDFFILCLSRNSVDRRGFMQKEIRAAFDKKEEMLDDDIYLIPVRLEDCNVRDEKLRRFQRVDLFENDGHEKLLFALDKGLKRRKQ